MRTVRFASTVIVLTAGSLLSLQGQSIPRLNSVSARQHVGEVATVCGLVDSSNCSRPGGTTITLAFATNDDPSRFALRIPSANREAFGRNPEDLYQDRIVCAVGRIEKRESHYEIVVTDPAALNILPDRPGLPAFAPDAHRPCDPDVELPRVSRDVKPQYTASAMQDKVEGGVVLQAVVQADGTIGDLRVIHSLHRDLDEEAIRATRQWRFVPGTFKGQPAPVLVTMEMTFTLRK